jgi:CelD/BcsL family acetyltransferase involved in cellulose biosynthesis
LSAARVREIDPSADPRWDEFVAAQPDGVVYQHSAWLRCLAAEYGHSLTGLCCEDAAGRLTGVLPLMATRGLPLLRGSESFGARLASLPRTPVAGPLAREPQTLAALLEAAVERARVAGVRLQVKRAAADLEGLAADLGGAPWRASHVVALPGNPAEIRFGNSRNHSRIRWAVNKATKEGLRVRDASGAADVRAWYRLYLETMREVLVPPRPLRLFEAMWRELEPRGLMRLHLAEHDTGGLAAGSIVLGLGRTAFYAFNGRRRSALRWRPNEVIQWEAIHAACAAGFVRYDLGEVAEGDAGLTEFKRKWGGEELRLHRYYHPPPEPATESTSTSPVERAAAAVWPRLPLSATRIAGDLAYRWL